MRTTLFRSVWLLADAGDAIDGGLWIPDRQVYLPKHTALLFRN
jgi:hypothetical protein